MKKLSTTTAILLILSSAALAQPHQFGPGDFQRSEAISALAVLTVAEKFCPQLKVNWPRVNKVFQFAGIGSSNDLTSEERRSLLRQMADWESARAPHVVCLLARDAYGEREERIVQGEPQWSGGSTIPGLLSETK